MKRALGFSMAAALAMLLGVGAASRAEDAPAAAKGTISGTVVDKDGKGLANVSVRIIATPDKGKTKLAADDKPANPPHEKPADQPGDKKGEKRPAAAEAKTGADGKFSVDVPAGHYTVVVAERGVGMGREKVEVEAGKTAEVKVTVTPRERKKAA